MSKILVNDDFTIEGEFSFFVNYDVTENPPRMEINGVLASSAGYLPEIYSLENERYVLDGVHVTQEDFGSEENTMMYHFAAKGFGIANQLKEVTKNER